MRSIHRSRFRSAELVGILASAALIRLWMLTTPALDLDGDEAVTGLMARRILDGHHFAYFAGQDYMGTVEQYLQAAVLAVLPDSDLVLRLPQVGLAVLSCLFVHRIARRSGLSDARALLAAAMFAVGPYFLVYWGSKSRGAYAIAMVLGLLGLLLALDTPSGEGDKRLHVAAFGLVAGLAFWSNQQAAYLLIPAALWLWPLLRDRPGRHVGIGAGAFLVGTAPALWRSITAGSPLLAALGGDSDPGDRASHLFSNTLPAFLGVVNDREPLFPWLPPDLVVTGFLVALVAAAVWRRRGLASIVQLRTDGRDGVDLLVAVLCLAPFLAIVSGASTNSTARFLFVLYPVVLIVLAATPMPAFLRGGEVPKVVAVGTVLLLLGNTLIGTRWLIAEDDAGRAWEGSRWMIDDQGNGPVMPSQAVKTDDVEALVTALRASGVETAYADYWLAFPLDWEADGDVLVEPLYERRFSYLTEAVDAATSPALVVNEEEIDTVKAELRQRGADFRVIHVAPWWIVTDIVPGVHLDRAPSIPVALVGA